MRTYIFDKGDSLSWELMPNLLERVHTFCKGLGTDMPAKYMQDLVMANFISDHPALLTVAVLTDSQRIAAYVIGTIDKRFEQNALTIQQYAMDEGVSRPLLNEGFQLLCDWAKDGFGVEDVFMMTFDKERERLFRIFWGFERHRILMKRKI